MLFLLSVPELKVWLGIDFTKAPCAVAGRALPFYERIPIPGINHAPHAKAHLAYCRFGAVA